MKTVDFLIYQNLLNVALKQREFKNQPELDRGRDRELDTEVWIKNLLGITEKSNYIDTKINTGM